MSVDEELPDVKCADCGLLALRNQKTQSLVEAPDFYRASGVPIAPGQSMNSVYSGAGPFCAALAADLAGEIAADRQEGAAGRVIGRARKCKPFMRWRPTFSPKEHQEMLDRAGAEREAREWREKQAKQDHVWRQQDAATADRRHKQNLIVAIVGIIAAALATLLATK